MFYKLALLPLASAIIAVFVIIPVSYMIGGKIAKISKTKKDGTVQTIDYVVAIWDTILASILAGIVGNFLNPIAGIIAFFGIIYSLLKQYKPSPKQHLIIFGLLIGGIAVGVGLNYLVKYYLPSPIIG